jgi:hypothetical protein
MVHFGKFVHSQTGKYVMSLLLGFGLASLFRNVCKDKNCIIFHAPALEEIKNKIYKYNDKCYKYNFEQNKCDLNKKIIDFA